MAKQNTVTNEESFERYRRIVEMDLKGGSYLDNLDAEMRSAPSVVTAAWSARYSRRRDCIEAVSGYGDPLADAVGPAALIARNRARDARVTKAPPWDPTDMEIVGMSFASLRSADRLDVGSLMEPHACGPSVRGLWAEALERGLVGPQVADYVIAWARHRPASWDRVRQRNTGATTSSLSEHLERAVGWTRGDDLEMPWGALVDGQTWRVRLNDFPDEPMYALLVDGVPVGDFHDWPEAWTSSDRPVVERPTAVQPSAPEAARTRRSATVAAGSLLARYQQGEREQVWADLVSLGPQVRERPYLMDAQAVAQETMRRARHNVELIVERLRQLDYHFWDPAPQTERKLRTVDTLFRGLQSAGFNFGNARDLMDRLTGLGSAGADQPREVYTPPDRQIRRRLASLELVVPGAALASLAAFLALRLIDGPAAVDASKLDLAVQLAAAGGAGALVFAAYAALLRLEELRTLRLIVGESLPRAGGSS